LLASGSPIIASVPATGTAARAVRQSGGGVVVPPESPQDLEKAIMSLYSNPVLVTKLGEKARNFAIERYSFEQALMAYEAVFYQAISRKVPGILPAIDKKLVPPELGVRS
jgi:colanic acid biosynthesis glycosyl transferase WcaI